jgi:hypothetical protein
LVFGVGWGKKWRARIGAAPGRPVRRHFFDARMKKIDWICHPDNWR